MKKRQSRTTPAIQLLNKGVMRIESEGRHLAVAYRLTRSRRARYLRLTIDRSNEVVLTLPFGCSPECGMRFMRTKTEWLCRHLVATGAPESLYRFLKKRGFLAVDGGKAFIDWRPGADEVFLSHREGAAKVVIGFDPERHGESELKQVLRQFASETLGRRTYALAKMRRLPVNQISVRDQISRWGSCSAKKNLSLNWRLLLVPPEVKDYVIWHELAHLLEMNHSDRFWRVLEGLDPRALHHDNVLTQVTNRIMRMGRLPES